MAHLKELKGQTWRQLLPGNDYSIILQHSNDQELLCQVSDTEIDYDDIKSKGNESVKKVDFYSFVFICIVLILFQYFNIHKIKMIFELKTH